jgi:NADH:ubiquinone oxidoreductase subunit 2 (subunit N)
MLVAVFAAQTGVAYAAVAKILSTSIQTISNVIQRVIGQTSEAALAHAHAYAVDEKQSLFALANKYTQTTIAALCMILCAVHYQAIATHAMTATLHTHALLITFGVLLLIEPLFITYEKKYLIEEKGHYLSYYHLTMMLLFAIWVYYKCAAPLLCLIGFTIVRLAWYKVLGMRMTVPRKLCARTSLHIIMCLIVISVIIIFC